MTATVRDAAKLLKQYVRQADTSASPGSLSTQEINKSDLPKAAKKVLGSICSRAGNSEGGLSVENYDRWIDRFAETFEKLDADRDQHLSAAELSTLSGNPELERLGIAEGSLRKFDLFVSSLSKDEPAKE